MLLAGFAAVTADVLLSGPLTRIDWAVHVFVEDRLRHPWWERLNGILATAGDQYVLVGALGALCLFAAARHRSLRPVLAVLSCAARSPSSSPASRS